MILVFTQFRLQDVFEVKARQCNFNCKFAPSGVDEMSGIVMTNKEDK